MLISWVEELTGCLIPHPQVKDVRGVGSILFSNLITWISNLAKSGIKTGHVMMRALNYTSECFSIAC